MTETKRMVQTMSLGEGEARDCVVAMGVIPPEVGLLI